MNIKKIERAISEGCYNCGNASVAAVVQNAFGVVLALCGSGCLAEYENGIPFDECD